VRQHSPTGKFAPIREINGLKFGSRRTPLSEIRFLRLGVSALKNSAAPPGLEIFFDD
jgi:hypothetical protein